MTLDTEGLLAPFAADNPCGEDLEYDPAFEALDIAAEPPGGGQFGEPVQVDHADVRKKALLVLERSKDLRATVHLATAVLHTDGLAGFADVLGYARGCLERYWETCHPQLDPDDGDPTMRINAVAGLAGRDTVQHALRRTGLTRSRAFGAFSLIDIQTMNGERAADEGQAVPDPTTLSAAFRDTDPEWLAASVAAITAAREHIKAIDAVFAEHTPAQGPDLDALNRLLRDIQVVFQTHAGLDAGPGVEEPPAGVAIQATAPAPGAGGGPAPVAAPGSISTPEDVIAALDRICEYYAKREPSSPVPLILERAKRLVNADFVTIIQDMAYSGLDQVKQVSGRDDLGD